MAGRALAEQIHDVGRLAAVGVPTEAASAPLGPVATGSLDCPSDGAVIVGDVLEVKGWCLFEGSRVARVDVVIDGRSVGLARPYVGRPDIAQQSAAVDAPVAGFELLASFERRDRSTESLVTVEAASLDGRRWRSRTHRVSWASSVPDDAHRGELLVQRSTALAEDLPRGSRVLVFTHELSYGGAQLWLLELLRQLVAVSALDCAVVSMGDGPLRGTLESLGISVHVTAPWRVDDVEAYEGRVRELAMLMRGSGAGAILVNTLGIFPAVDAAIRASLPAVWAIHESFDPAEYRHINWGPRGMHPHVQARFNACFGSTRALVFEARQTAELFAHLCSPEQRFIVDYGVDVDAIDAYRASLDRSALRAALGYDDDSVVMVVVGVFDPRKAQAAVVAAFDELAAVHDRLRLAVVGSHPCPYAASLQDQLSRCAARERVDVVPIAADIYAWYAAADILLCASDVESLPRSILEAMAFELPVVSTDAFGIADLLEDGRTGWLTRPRDLEGLLGLLHLVLRLSPEERRAAGAQARNDILHRHGDRSYGRVFARALGAALEDPCGDLRRAFSHSDAAEMAR